MQALKYTDGMDYTGEESFEGWNFRHSEWRGGEVQTLMGHHEELELVQHVSQGNWVWQTEQICAKSGMRQLRTRRGRVAEIRECRSGEYVALIDFGEELARADLRSIVVDIATEGETWALEAPEGMEQTARSMTEWVDVTEEAEIPEIESTDELTFEKIEGRGAQNRVNAFLEGAEDGTVHHGCGGVHHWKAAFVARYDGDIVGAIVLAPPQNGVLAAEGKEIVISRIACHPNRPHNTSTWLISRARKWAERAGYSRISSLAGVDGNEGSCYKGAGFELESEEAGYCDGNGDKWHKRRYVYQLNPEKYAGRDVPMPGVDYGTASA